MFGEGSSTNYWWRIIFRAETLVKDLSPWWHHGYPSPMFQSALWNIGEGYPSPKRYAPTPMIWGLPTGEGWEKCCLDSLPPLKGIWPKACAYWRDTIPKIRTLTSCARVAFTQSCMVIWADSELTSRSPYRSAVLVWCTGQGQAWTSKAGRRVPRSRKINGGCPPKMMIFQYLFSWHIWKVWIFHYFHNKVAEIWGETKFSE